MRGGRTESHGWREKLPEQQRIRELNKSNVLITENEETRIIGERQVISPLHLAFVITWENPST